MGKYLTEFTGTFFLVFAIGMTSGNPLAPVATGAILVAIVYMGCHVSGAHYNPAVTLGIFMRGKLSATEVVPYVAAQIFGAVLAPGVILLLAGSSFAPAPGSGVNLLQALLAELLFAFALVLVVLNVATAKATEGNSYYGLAIGFTVTAGAFAVGPVSGGVFNPAVGTGPILVSAMAGSGGLGNLWLYWVGPLVGGGLAALAFDLQNPSG